MLDVDTYFALDNVIWVFYPAFVIFGDLACFSVVEWATREVKVFLSEGGVINFDFLMSIFVVCLHLSY